MAANTAAAAAARATITERASETEVEPFFSYDKLVSSFFLVREIFPDFHIKIILCDSLFSSTILMSSSSALGYEA